MKVHVKGFTQHTNSAVPEHRLGTFLGLIDKIPYLKSYAKVEARSIVVLKAERTI